MRLSGPVVVLALYGIAVATLVSGILSRTGNVLVYPLDDTYIHMAIAKHMAIDGVWGVTAERFTSASSSPLWTGLLAVVYAISGPREWAPLLLNVVSGAALLFSVNAIFVRGGLRSGAAVIGTLVVLVLGLIPTLTLLGMEHTVHALVTVWFVLLGAEYATSSQSPVPSWTLAALAAVLVMIRFEGVFAVAAVAAALALAGRWRAAMAVAGAGLAAIAAFAAWSIAQGGPPLPNSVLLKGAIPAATGSGWLRTVFFTRALAALAAAPHLAALLISVLALTVFPSSHSRRAEWRVAAIVFAGVVFLHLQFAAVGWFFRYEAYLVILGLVIVTLQLRAVDWRVLMPWSPAAGIAMLLLVVVLCNPLALRAWHGFRQVPLAASNIFEQQYQVAQFLNVYYQGQRVAVNDVGAIAFLTDVRLLDLYGLASDDVRALKRSGAYSAGTVERLAASSGAAIAVIYPTFLEQYGGVPADWQMVGQWSVDDNVVLGENGVSFFGVDGEAAKRLTENLARFSSRLPSSVHQSGVYLAGR
jgi:hypothetical protein